MPKRSAQIEAAFVSAVAAAALAGCNEQVAYRRDWEQCVNQANVVVDDKWCEPRTRVGGGLATAGYYHWLYSPRPYRAGSRITDGYGTPRLAGPATRTSRSGAFRSGGSSSITRGGFGSSSHFGGS